jgi:hypothetical protein
MMSLNDLVGPGFADSLISAQDINDEADHRPGVPAKHRQVLGLRSDADPERA